MLVDPKLCLMGLDACWVIPILQIIIDCKISQETAFFLLLLLLISEILSVWSQPRREGNDEIFELTPTAWRMGRILLMHFRRLVWGITLLRCVGFCPGSHGQFRVLQRVWRDAQKGASRCPRRGDIHMHLCWTPVSVPTIWGLFSLLHCSEWVSGSSEQPGHIQGSNPELREMFRFSTLEVALEKISLMVSCKVCVVRPIQPWCWGQAIFRLFHTAAWKFSIIPHVHYCSPLPQKCTEPCSEV